MPGRTCGYRPKRVAALAAQSGSRRSPPEAGPAYGRRRRRASRSRRVIRSRPVT